MACGTPAAVQNLQLVSQTSLYPTAYSEASSQPIIAQDDGSSQKLSHFPPSLVEIVSQDSESREIYSLPCSSLIGEGVAKENRFCIVKPPETAGSQFLAHRTDYSARNVSKFDGISLWQCYEFEHAQCGLPWDPSWYYHSQHGVRIQLHSCTENKVVVQNRGPSEIYYHSAAEEAAVLQVGGEHREEGFGKELGERKL